MTEGRRGEDGKRSSGFYRGPEVSSVNDLAHLAELDQQLWRVGRHDQHIGMRLDKDAGFFLVDIAHLFAGVDGFSDARVQVGCFANSFAVRAASAKIRQTVGLGPLKAIDGAHQHESKGVLARALGARENQRLGNTLRTNAFAQTRNRCRIAEKIAEAHDSSLEHGPRNAVDCRVRNGIQTCKRERAITLIPFLGRRVIFGCSSIF